MIFYMGFIIIAVVLFCASVVLYGLYGIKTATKISKLEIDR